VGASSLGRPWIILLGALGTALYLVILDLGVSAGRVHHGVEISGLDLGGLTEREAAAALTARAEEMRATPVVFFRGPGIRLSLSPKDVRWKPLPEDTARAAMRIGRERAPLGALVDRVAGWLRGVRLDWVGHAAPGKVSRYVDRVEGVMGNVGLQLDRARFRYKIKRGLRAWPRQALRIPAIES
jgi:hypothetical protein